MSAADSLATSEMISDPADEAAPTSVDDDVADAVEPLDDEFDDCSAASKLARSVSSVDRRLEALDELSLELDEVESLALDAPGGGPGGGPPTPPTPPADSPPAELPLLSEASPPSCERKLSTAADRPIAVEASEVETALLADVEVDALALHWSDELFRFAPAAWSSLNNRFC